MNCLPWIFFRFDSRPSQMATCASTMKYFSPFFSYMTSSLVFRLIGMSSGPGAAVPRTGAAWVVLVRGQVEADVLGGVLGTGEQDRLVVEVDHPAVVGGADLLEDRAVELRAERVGQLGVVEVEQADAVDADHRRVLGQL